MLCTTCQLATAGGSDIQKRKGTPGVIQPTSRPVYLHHRTFQSFNLAVIMGCSICNMLWYTYHDENSASNTRLSKGCRITYGFDFLYPEARGVRNWIFDILPRSGPIGQRIKLGLLKDEPPTNYNMFEPESIHTFASQDHKQVLHEIEHEIESSTGSLACVNLASYWLSTCQTKHAECRAATHIKYPLPLRVIDVGSFGESSVRLFISDSSPKYAKYLTLSHCWGSANILKLTLENEGTLKKGFTIRGLPKTFRQAIHFTRALSIRYLWVDSLCIIQDSVDDWRHQSALMGDIYRNCYCNIAATRSDDSNGGIFATREPRSVKPLKLVLTIANNYDGGKHHGVYYCWKDGAWRNLVENAPSNNRGWVLQERLLSPRVLHFSDYIFWECKSVSACEIAPTGKPDLDTYNGNESFYTSLILAIDKLSTECADLKDGGCHSIKKAHSAWWELVFKYSQCQLSKDDDILVAISGVAKVVERAMNDEYLAGLWRSMLLIDLLWNTKRSQWPTENVLTTRPIPVRAPTWSWASIKGQVWPSDHNHLPDIDSDRNPLVVFIAEIVDVRIEATGDDQTGQVDMGFLSVRGSIFNGVFGKPWEGLEENLLIQIGHHEFCGFVYIDDLKAMESCKGKKDTDLLCMPICTEGPGPIDHEKGLESIGSNEEFKNTSYEEQTQGDELESTDEVEDEAGRITLKGLVLAPVEDCEGHFVRIGVFNVVLQATLRSQYPWYYERNDLHANECDYGEFQLEYRRITKPLIVLV
jgi:hypothetical protein